MTTTTKSTRTRKTSATTAKSAKTRKQTTVKKAPTAAKAAVKAPVSSAKAAKATVANKADNKTLNPLERLRSMHVTSAVLYLLFAGLVVGFVKTASVAITLPFQARDEFASGNNVVLSTAYEVLYNVQPKFYLVASLLVAAVISVLLATRLRSRYEATIAGRVSGFRWITIGISSSLLLGYVYLLAGMGNIWVYKLAGAMILVTTLLGWIAERDNIGATRPHWMAYVLSLVTGAVAWLPLVASMIGTSVYGQERYGWIVYAVALVTLLGFTGFAVRQYRQIKGLNTGEFVYTEAGYYQIDLFTKFAVVILSLIALK